MTDILFLLAAAVVSVLISSRLGMGSVVGYIAAGAMIGPFGAALITDADNLRHIGEFGVVFLLFMIGLEMKPRRLWLMRHLVFGMGGVQVLVTGLTLAAGAIVLGAQTIMAAMIIGFGLALSSTAFAIQLMSERAELNSHYGRNSIAILLFQDLAVVPLMVLLPLLAAGTGMPNFSWLAIGQSAALVFAIVVVGRFATGPMLRAIANLGNVDTFIALILLLVLGFAWAMKMAGLSLAMGAFMAGVLLAESECRHQIEADIQPFRSLLLGLFFMSVGMSLDPGPVTNHLGVIVAATGALLLIKTGLIVAIALAFKSPLPVAVRSGFLLSQGGEFGFVLFSLADGFGLFAPETLDILIAIVVISMVLTPAMLWLGTRIGTALQREPDDATHSEIAEIDRPVLIAGFGRVGETVANMLRAVEVPYVAIDANPDCVAHARRRGYNVFYGNASRPEVLRSVGAAHARLLVITLDDPNAAEILVRCVRNLFPDLAVHVRVRDWDIADAFSALGVDHAMPETVEASLRLGAAALEAAGIDEERRRALFDQMSAENFAKMRGKRQP